MDEVTEKNCKYSAGCQNKGILTEIQVYKITLHCNLPNLIMKVLVQNSERVLELRELTNINVNCWRFFCKYSTLKSSPPCYTDVVAEQQNIS